MKNTLTTVLLKTDTDYWHIDTSGESGVLRASLCHGTATKDRRSWEYRMAMGPGDRLTDGFHRLIYRKVPRCTQRVVADAHAEAEVLGHALYQMLTGAQVSA